MMLEWNISLSQNGWHEDLVTYDITTNIENRKFSSNDLVCKVAQLSNHEFTYSMKEDKKTKENKET